MSKKEYEELSKAEKIALQERGVFRAGVVEVRRGPEGNQDRLIEGGQRGWVVRGWWKHGESAEDIEWGRYRIGEVKQ